MNESDRVLLKNVIERLTRIEHALLGDPEHSIWGYKDRLTNLEKKDKKYSEDIGTLQRKVEANRSIKFTVIILSGLIGTIIGVILTSILN